MINLLPRIALVGVCVVGASTAAAQDAPPPPASQAPGTCIAMALPTVKGADDATQLATAVRDLFTSFLQGPSIKVWRSTQDSHSRQPKKRSRSRAIRCLSRQ